MTQISTPRMTGQITPLSMHTLAIGASAPDRVELGPRGRRSWPVRLGLGLVCYPRQRASRRTGRRPRRRGPVWPPPYVRVSGDLTVSYGRSR
jgi:hypothetical protein